jgi:hypothetical protein
LTRYTRTLNHARVRLVVHDALARFQVELFTKLDGDHPPMAGLAHRTTQTAAPGPG